MEHLRDMVNWTDFPAIHWFSFPGMRRAFRAVGLEPLDRLDLIARRGAGGREGVIASAMSLLPGLKPPCHLYAISLAMCGVRR